MKTEASGKASETVCLNLFVLWSFFFFLVLNRAAILQFEDGVSSCMQCLLKCNAKTIFFVEVANLFVGSKLNRDAPSWWHIWPWVWKHWFPWMWKCVHIDPNHVYVDLFLLLLCNYDWTVKSKYYASSCIGKDWTHYVKLFFRLNVVSSDEKLH